MTCDIYHSCEDNTVASHLRQLVVGLLLQVANSLLKIYQDQALSHGLGMLFWMAASSPFRREAHGVRGFEWSFEGFIVSVPEGDGLFDSA